MPDAVDREIDLYWVRKAGYDPADYFERYRGRFPLWHVKDGGGPKFAMTDVGAGEIDFARLVALSVTAGLKHAFVERDQPDDGLDVARRSLRYLRSL